MAVSPTCKSCGVEVERGAKRCPKCGVRGPCKARGPLILSSWSFDRKTGESGPAKPQRKVSKAPLKAVKAVKEKE